VTSPYRAATIPLLRLWKTLSFRQRIAVVFAPLSFVIFIATFLLSSSDDYVPVCKGMGDRNLLFSISDRLDQAKIPCKIVDHGHGVSVPSSQFAAATAVVAEVVEKGRKGSNESDSVFGGSIFMPSVGSERSEIRQREKQLARNISCYKGVHSARVMIIPPDKRIFAKKSNKEPSATVFLELSDGKPVEACRAVGIKKTVASGYRGLTEGKVHIADSIGTDYEVLVNEFDTNEMNFLREQEEQAEKVLEKKVKLHLSMLFGKNNVSIASTVAFKKCGRGRIQVIEQQSLSVFIDKNIIGDNELSPHDKKSLIQNISAIVRLNPKRGDTISFQVVPFKKSSATKQAALQGNFVAKMSGTKTSGTKMSGIRVKIVPEKTDVEEKPVSDMLESMKEPVSAKLIVRKSPVISLAALDQPVTTNKKKKSQITLSTLGRLGSSSESSYFSISFVGLPFLVSLFCVLIFLVRRQDSNDDFVETKQSFSDFTFAESDLAFADVEGSYCPLPPYAYNEEEDALEHSNNLEQAEQLCESSDLCHLTYSQSNTCDEFDSSKSVDVAAYDEHDRIYREDFIVQTADDNPDLLASMIRQNESLKNNEW